MPDPRLMVDSETVLNPDRFVELIEERFPQLEEVSWMPDEYRGMPCFRYNFNYCGSIHHILVGHDGLKKNPQLIGSQALEGINSQVFATTIGLDDV